MHWEFNDDKCCCMNQGIVIWGLDDRNRVFVPREFDLYVVMYVAKSLHEFSSYIYDEDCEIRKMVMTGIGTI